MEASLGTSSGDSRLFKSLTPGVGWAIMGMSNIYIYIGKYRKKSLKDKLKVNILQNYPFLRLQCQNILHFEILQSN